MCSKSGRFSSLAKVILLSTGFFSQLTVTAYYSVHTGNVIKLLDPASPWSQILSVNDAPQTTVQATLSLSPNLSVLTLVSWSITIAP